MKSLLLMFIIALTFSTQAQARVETFKMYTEPGFESDPFCDLYIEMQYYAPPFGKGFIATENKLAGQCELSQPAPAREEYDVISTSGEEVLACKDGDVSNKCVRLTLKGKYAYLRSANGTMLYSENAPRLEQLP